MALEECPRGHTDQVQKVTAARSVNELLRDRLNLPPESPLIELLYQPMLLKELKRPLSYPVYKRPPMIDWKKSREAVSDMIMRENNALMQLFLIIVGVPIVVLSVIAVVLALFLWPLIVPVLFILFGSNQLAVVGILAYTGLGVYVYILLITGPSKDKAKWRENYRRTELENERIAKENMQIEKDNEPIRRNNDEKSRKRDEAHRRYLSQKQRWQNKLYYCHRHDIVFIPGENKEASPERMTDIL